MKMYKVISKSGNYSFFASIQLFSIIIEAHMSQYIKANLVPSYSVRYHRRNVILLENCITMSYIMMKKLRFIIGLGAQEQNERFKNRDT